MISKVAPHMGAWIEIICLPPLFNAIIVAPHMGAWIEIICLPPLFNAIIVAPHMGAWIEIQSPLIKAVAVSSRTPHGCVDYKVII